VRSSHLMDRFMEARFDQMGPAMRALAARRLGVNTTLPRIMAEMLRSYGHVGSVHRRLSETSAWDFVSVLVEAGGQRVKREEAFEELAARVATWFPLDETAEGWRVEPEVAHAMARWVHTERYAYATLLGRADEETVAGLLRRFDIAPTGSVTGRRVDLITRLLAEPRSAPSLRTLAEETVRRGPLPADRVAGVRIPEDFHGLAFDLTLRDGTVCRVVPREVIEALGVDSSPLAAQALEQEAPTETRLRIPTAMRTGAILHFVTPKDCDQALRIEAFSEVVLYRLDPCRVATREECDHRRALTILQRAGFAGEEDERRVGEVRDASR
jgi:hypothetical protein